MSASFQDELTRLANLKSPVPPDVILAALLDYDEKSTLEELRQIRENGGFVLADFYSELERIAKLSSGGV